MPKRIKNSINYFFKPYLKGEFYILQVSTPIILYIIQVPTNALNSKIPPTEHRTIAYVVNPSTKGAGTKNIATMNLKTLSALF